VPIGFNAANERGPSLQDQRHRLVMSGLYAAPYGINVSSIVTVASGRPYNVLAGADLNGDGDGGTIPGPDRARATLTDPSSSVSRNSATLPTQATVDVRVSKRIAFPGRASLEAIFEVFNLFNRANFTDVNNIFGTGSYPSRRCRPSVSAGGAARDPARGEVELLRGRVGQVGLVGQVRSPRPGEPQSSAASEGRVGP
jgi:hypothetical protein